MKQKKPLVSIVTPCFNGEGYLDRYFNCILNQTYPCIQVVFVDDGSTDATYEIAESYREKIEVRGFEFILLHQGGSGQAAAINLALPYVRGEYISWIDSDDIMYADCIERKVSELERARDYGFACSQVNIVDESDLSKVIGTFKRKQIDDPWLFESLLAEQDSYCCNIAYLARTDVLKEVIPQTGIYESRSGQNWQLLLPLAYTSKCLFINEPLASYVVRTSSHSHSIVSPQQRLQRTYDLEDILKNVISGMDLCSEERIRIESFIEAKYLSQRYRLAIELEDSELLYSSEAGLNKHYGRSLYRFCMGFAYRLHLGKAALRVTDTAYSIKRLLSQGDFH